MSNILPHVASLVFNTPLMILPEKLEAIQQVLGARIGVTKFDEEAVNKELAVKMAVKKQVASSNRVDIAVIPIIGSLVYRTTGMDSWSGLRTYKGIEEDLNAAIDDPQVDAILFDVSSPGGSVEGVFGLADKIRAAGNKKPIYSYVNEHAYSAGYLLASAASGGIFMPKTGGVGSIGVRMSHVDVSKMDEMNGVKVTNLYAGARKVDFDPHTPLSKEAYDSAMKEINELYDLFCECVADYRSLSVDDIKKTEAGLFQGKHAVKAGLADKIMSFDDAINYIVSDMASKKQSKKMSTNNFKEVKGIMSYTTLAELKADNPGFYNQLLEEAKLAVMPELKKTFDEQRTVLEAKLGEKDSSIQSLEASVLQLQKVEFIRAKKEAQTRIESAADRIWTKALATSEVPEDMHVKVRRMVNTMSFVTGEKDDEKVLNETAFEEAVKAEIADWEGKGMKTSILGAGFGGNKDSVIKGEKDKDAEADDKWVDMMHAKATKKREGGER